MARDFPDEPAVQVALRLWSAFNGDRARVEAPLGERERAAAWADESWSYFMAAAYALIGDADQALEWFEHTIKDCGWIDYTFFSEREPFLRRLATDPRYQELMAFVRERYERFEA
jgi:hypothetical protein